MTTATQEGFQQGSVPRLTHNTLLIMNAVYWLQGDGPVTQFAVRDVISRRQGVEIGETFLKRVSSLLLTRGMMDQPNTGSEVPPLSLRGTRVLAHYQANNPGIFKEKTQA